MIGVNTIISVAATLQKVAAHAQRVSMKMQKESGFMTRVMRLKMERGSRGLDSQGIHAEGITRTGESKRVIGIG